MWLWFEQSLRWMNHHQIPEKVIGNEFLQIVWLVKYTIFGLHTWERLLAQKDQMCMISLILHLLLLQGDSG